MWIFFGSNPTAKEGEDTKRVALKCVISRGLKEQTKKEKQTYKYSPQKAFIRLLVSAERIIPTEITMIVIGRV